MSSDVIIVGVGGFGRETLDVIEAHNLENPRGALSVLGVADDNPSEMNLDRLTSRGYRYLGTIVDAFHGAQDTLAIIAVGSPQARRSISDLLCNMGIKSASVVHPTAVIGSEFRAGDGLVICAGAQISTNVTLGEHVHINPSAVIGHDTELKDFVSVNPNATVSGECVVAEGVLIGAASVVLQGITVCDGAVVGAAACVTKQVPADAVMVGVPAREMERR